MWQEYMGKEKSIRPEQEKLQKEVSHWQTQLKEIQHQLSSLEKQDSRTEEFNKLQKQYQDALDSKNKLHEKEMMLKNKIELAKRVSVMDTTPMPVDEIVKYLESIEKDVSGIKEVSGIPKIVKRLLQLISDLRNPSKHQQRETDTKELVSGLEEISNKLQAAQKEISQHAQEISDFNKKQDQQKGKFFELQKSFQEKQTHYHQSSQKYSDVKIELTKIETHREDLEREIKDELHDIEWLKNFRFEGQRNKEFLASEIQRLKHQLELIGGIDPEIVEEYEKTKERYDFLDTQSQDLNASMNSLKKVVNDLDETIQKQFDLSFKNINKDFQKYFKVLFSGGRSELVLLKDDSKDIEEEKKLEQAMEGVDAESDEETEEAKEDEEMKKMFKGKTGKVIRGIEISATPPGKKLKNIQMLSGGERALTSIALICAIISTNPSPFVVLDEVDAALDEANSERFAAILEELSEKTQFIVITHNRSTMHKANILYGVTMGDDGVSKLLSLKLEDAEKTLTRAG